jgi:hypothetical protein
MSKEQTPIDFESYIERMGYSWKDFDYSHQMEGLIEQYANAKVLVEKEQFELFMGLVSNEFGRDKMFELIGKLKELNITKQK